MWASVNAAFIQTGGQGGWTGGGTMYVDPSDPDPDKTRAAYFVLNSQYNNSIQQPQQPITAGDTFDQIFDQYGRTYPQGYTVPIVPMLLKAGASGAADALTQALFIWLTEPDVYSFLHAFSHEKFSKAQVARSMAEGLIPWRTPGGKIGKAAMTAAGCCGECNRNEYEDNQVGYDAMGTDFMLGFFSSLAGGEIGELAIKYNLDQIGIGLLRKMKPPIKQ
jgi:hypothetical protein